VSKGDSVIHSAEFLFAPLTDPVVLKVQPAVVSLINSLNVDRDETHLTSALMLSPGETVCVVIVMLAAG